MTQAADARAMAHAELGRAHSRVVTCDNCHGTGTEQTIVPASVPMRWTTSPCWDCKGTGQRVVAVTPEHDGWNAWLERMGL